MSVLGGYISNLGMGNRSVQTHNSVEGLIRSALGSRFIETPTQKQEPIPEPATQRNPEPIQEKLAEKKIESTLNNINEVLKETRGTDISERVPQKKKVKKTPPPQAKKKSPGIKRLSPFQEALLLESESFTYEDNQDRQEDPPIYVAPKPQPQEQESLGPIIRRKEYIFHRDSDETFECKVNIEGGSQDSNKARLFLKTDVWNLTFDGSIRKDGTCQVPLKKLTVLPEGTTGTAFLEIIVDDVVFIPWESPFRVGTYKRVSVQAPSLSRR